MSASSPQPNLAPQSSAPVTIEYPQGAYGSNFPTPDPQSPNSQDTIATALKVRQISDRGDAILSDTTLVPIPSTLNTCYRDASLAGLLALRVFLGYLDDRVASVPPDDEEQKGAQHSNIATHLLQIARSQWNSSIDSGTKRKDLVAAVTQFWSFWQQQLGKNAGDEQEDVVLFLQDLLQELYMLSPQDTDDPSLFQRLFQSQFIGRVTFECNCTAKERQSFKPTDNRFVVTSVINEERPTVESALAWSLYDEQGHISAQCTNCKLSGHRHRYLKFRYLPEVLFVQIDFIRTDKQNTRDSHRRCALPDLIDLGAVCNKVAKEGDHVDDSQLAAQEVTSGTERRHSRSAMSYIYKLKFVVDYSGVTTKKTSTGHYRCHVRRDNDQWDSLDGLQRRASTVPSTLDRIANNPRFQPRLLAYERQPSGSIPTVEKSPVVDATLGSSANAHREAPAEVVEPSGPELENSPKGRLYIIGDDHAGSLNDDRTVPQMRQEMTQKGIALPPNRNRDDHLRILQKHHNNPKDYALYTMAALKQLMKERDLKFEDKSVPRKADLVEFLTARDRQLPVVSTAPSQNLQGAQTLPINAQGDEQLQNKIDDLQQQNNELHQQIQKLQMKLGEHQSIHSAHSDQAAEGQTARPGSPTPRSVHRGLLNNLETQPALLVSVKIEQAGANAGALMTICRKYILQLPGGSPGLWVNTRVQTNIVPSQGPDDTARIDIVVMIGPYRHGVLPDGSRQETISISLPGHVDTSALTAGAEVELIHLSGPLLIYDQQLHKQHVSSAVGAGAGSKRKLDEAMFEDTEISVPGPSKRPK